MEVNAKIELIEAITDLNKSIEDIDFIYVAKLDYNIYEFKKILLKQNPLLENFDIIDFDYDNGYGTQELDGYVKFKDNTWLERYEYDGSENWNYKEPLTYEYYKQKQKED